MKLLAATIMPLSLLASAFAQTKPGGDMQTVKITRSGSQPSQKGPAEYFTSSVRIDPLFKANDPSRTSGASVTFEPGARTAWHTHPLGQHLIVTDGFGWVQQWGGQIEEIRQDDVVWIPPGQKHWHGATATTAMTHIAIQEHLDGKVVEWMEKVSDEQYPKISHKEANVMKIRLTVNGKAITATLIDNETTRDFISLLPLTLTMNDLFKREKFAHLLRAISNEGKRTHTYEVGDVAYWPPGPDVAIFYRHDGQEIPDPGIIVIGKIDSGVEAFDVPGSVKVKMELTE